MAINRPSSIRHLIIATPRYKRRATKILFLLRIERHSPPNGAIETLPPSRNFDFLSRNSIDDRPFFAPRGVVHLDSKEGTADRYGGAEVRAYVETFLSTILYLFLVLSFLFFFLLFFTRISTHTHTHIHTQVNEDIHATRVEKYLQDFESIWKQSVCWNNWFDSREGESSVEI